MKAILGCTAPLSLLAPLAPLAPPAPYLQVGRLPRLCPLQKVPRELALLPLPLPSVTSVMSSLYDYVVFGFSLLYQSALILVSVKLRFPSFNFQKWLNGVFPFSSLILAPSKRFGLWHRILFACWAKKYIFFCIFSEFLITRRGGGKQKNWKFCNDFFLS